MTQNNLGTALRTLGERTESVGTLREAVEACAAALELVNEAEHESYAEVIARNLKWAESSLHALTFGRVQASG